jgi:hypothetical protein
MKFTITDSPNPNYWALGARLTEEQAVKVLGLNPGETITAARMASHMLSRGFHFSVECEEGDSPQDHGRFQMAANCCLPRDF